MNIRDEALNQLEQFGENNLGLYASERNFDYGPQKEQIQVIYQNILLTAS